LSPDLAGENEMKWALFGRVVSVHPGTSTEIGSVWRIGLRTFASKQEARAAKNEKIREQIYERNRSVTYRFFAAKVEF
jgi:hypothetical protein